MAAARTSTEQSASAPLSLISQKKVSPQDARGVLTAALAAHDYLDCIANLTERHIDPQAYVDGLDHTITTLPSESDIYYRSLRALRKTCGIYETLPASYRVPRGLTLVTIGQMKRPFASGGFSDVWKARNDEGQIFAIKHLRTYETDDLTDAKKKYCKDVTICRRVRHENVLNIEGIVPELFEFCMVSKWMDNGNMLEYVRTKEQVDRVGLLIGITRGLQHLHSNKFIHGDLKGPNILIDSKGNPLLADFGLSSVMNSVTSADATLPHTGSTVRWAAPELLDVFPGKRRKRTPTIQSDMYALSMVIIELYTGKIPFPNSPDPTVILLVARGRRPPKPVSGEALGLTPTIWELTKRCWHKNPAKRPDTSEILAYLENKKVGLPLPLLRRLERILAG